MFLLLFRLIKSSEDSETNVTAVIRKFVLLRVNRIFYIFVETHAARCISS